MPQPSNFSDRSKASKWMKGWAPVAVAMALGLSFVAGGMVATIGFREANGVRKATIATGSVVENLGYVPVNKAGDAMRGPLVVKAPAATANDADAVSSAWVKQFFPGLDTRLPGLGTSGMTGPFAFGGGLGVIGGLNADQIAITGLLNIGPGFGYTHDDAGLTLNGSQVIDFRPTAVGSAGQITSGLTINGTLPDTPTLRSTWLLKTVLNDKTPATKLAGVAYPQSVAIQASTAKLANGSSPMWAAQFNLDDFVDAPTSVRGAMIGLEIGMNGNNVDDAKARRGVDFICATHENAGERMHCSYGFYARGDNLAQIDSAFAAQGKVGRGLDLTGLTSGVGIDLSGSTLTGPALRLGTHQELSWEPTDTISERWTGSLDIFSGTTRISALSRTGDLSLPGTIEASKYHVGGSVGVSCAYTSAPTPTLVVRNGIVTHC